MRGGGGGYGISRDEAILLMLLDLKPTQALHPLNSNLQTETPKPLNP